MSEHKFTVILMVHKRYSSAGCEEQDICCQKLRFVIIFLSDCLLVHEIMWTHKASPVTQIPYYNGSIMLSKHSIFLCASKCLNGICNL